MLVEMVIDHFAQLGTARLVALKERTGTKCLYCLLNRLQTSALTNRSYDKSNCLITTREFIYRTIKILGGEFRRAMFEIAAREYIIAKAELVRKNGQAIDNVFEIECSPWDALAIAVGMNKPIMVSDEVLEVFGVTAHLTSDTCANQEVIQDFRYKQVLNGIAASKGSILGLVRNIAEEDTFGIPDIAYKIQPMEIIVANPPRGYINHEILRKVSGVVLDGNGRTCSVVVVARELNIPAVVATHKATLVLIDGQLIVVDGDMGAVYSTKCIDITSNQL